MKRHVWLIFVLLFASELSIADDIQSSGIDLKDCKMLTRFYNIWKESLFGREPDRIERAAWIKLNGGGEYEFLKWEKTTEKQTISWQGSLPEKVVAAVHTHPSTVDPKPSQGDALVAARLNIPIYTISRKGIWKVTPQGEVIQEGDRLWYKEVKENPCEESDQEL
jgi:hypothetical protein